MKNRIIYLLSVLLISSSVFGQRANTLKNRLDSVSYAVGVSMYEGAKQFGFKLDYDKVAVALLATRDSSAIMDLEFANEYINRIYRQVQQAEELENKRLGEKFLDENKKVAGIIVTQSGLQYRIIKKGNGPIPTKDSKVKVNYKGYLLDGYVFDSSFDRGGPAVFNLNSVVAGWIEVIQLMPVGSEYVVYIPHYLAYGERVMGGGDIPAYSTLIFEIQLLEIVK